MTPDQIIAQIRRKYDLRDMECGLCDGLTHTQGSHVEDCSDCPVLLAEIDRLKELVQSLANALAQRPSGDNP